MDLGIKGKRAAVAAASAGLGFGSAAALAAEGATVVICGRDRRRIDDAAQKIGPGAIAIVADVSDSAGAQRFVAASREALGGIDILVTNGSGPAPGTAKSTPLDAYPPALELNLTSQVAMCLAVIEEMKQQQWGRIVAITSVAVRQPMAQLILSNTARSGYTAFLKTLAREVAADGVTVNSLQPGLHLTERLASLHGNDTSSAASSVPAQQLGDPADFGAYVAWLCSYQAKFVTGTHTPVDGGYCAALL